MLSKRSYDSDKWLIIGVTVGVFAFFAIIGSWTLCYRRRGHKRRMDRRRIMAAKTRGNYALLNEEKAEAAEGVQLVEQLGSRTSSTAESPPTMPQGPQSVAGLAPTFMTDDAWRGGTSAPYDHPQTGGVPVPQSHYHQYPHPHLTSDTYLFTNLNRTPYDHSEIQQPHQSHIEPHSQRQHHAEPGLFLPLPIVPYDGARRASSSEGRTYHGHDDEYDGRTGHRYDRSRTPSPDAGRLLATRSASMLRPR